VISSQLVLPPELIATTRDLLHHGDPKANFVRTYVQNKHNININKKVWENFFGGEKKAAAMMSVDVQIDLVIQFCAEHGIQCAVLEDEITAVVHRFTFATSEMLHQLLRNGDVLEADGTHGINTFDFPHRCHRPTPSN